MTDFPETRESLLLQLSSPANREAWDRFVALYRPVIYRLARRRGMQDADAQDLTQQVFVAVASAIARFEKQEGSGGLRHWLRRIAGNAIINALSRRPRDRATGGTSVQELLAEQRGGDDESATEIELEYRRELYLQAAAIVRGDVESDTWRAFELTVIENRPIEAAALELNKPVGVIYAARSRIMRRLRDAVKELERAES